MRRFYSAIILVIAFVLTYTVAPREDAKLQAQVGIPCQCTEQIGNPGPGPNTFPCIGTADMTPVTCSPYLSQCFISGWAKWTAAPKNCNVNSATGGAISATGTGQGGPSWFNPTVTNVVPGIPVGVLSADCTPINAFGARMEVIHQPFRASDCKCLSGSLIVLPVAQRFYTCSTA